MTRSPYFSNKREEKETTAIMELPSSQLEESVVYIAISPKVYEELEEWSKGYAVTWDGAIKMLLEKKNNDDNSKAERYRIRRNKFR